jgi:hypothetical protein
MSEIFSWLKRAEVERRKWTPDEVSWPSEEEKVTDVPAITKDSKRSTDLEVHVPDTLDIRSDVRFDLHSADRQILAVMQPFTLVGEQYRLLRAKLSLMQKERGIKTLLVTSSVPDEGKTFTACCLSGIIAQEPGRKVLLIDADLRKPMIERSLGMTGGVEVSGLAQVLRGEADAG